MENEKVILFLVCLGLVVLATVYREAKNYLRKKLSKKAIRTIEEKTPIKLRPDRVQKLIRPSMPYIKNYKRNYRTEKATINRFNNSPRKLQ